MPAKSSRPPQPTGDLGRYAGLGLQFALTMALLGGLGWWLDGRFGTLPWLLITGVLVGAVGGFVRIVKAVPGSQSFTPKSPPLPDEEPERDPWAEPDDGAKERAE
jgi:hypothetical protein